MNNKKTKRSRINRASRAKRSVKKTRKVVGLSIKSRTLCINGECDNILCINGKCRQKHMERPIKNSVIVTLKKSKGKARKTRKSRKIKKKFEV